MSEDASAAAEASGSGEVLSCVSCRNRKLKCDRTKPRCKRCEKANHECVFPESRRKPAFKRRNVKELEARLAQVEVLLQEANKNKPSQDKADETSKPNDEPTDETANSQSAAVPATENVFQDMDFTTPDSGFDDSAPFLFQQDLGLSFSPGNTGGQDQGQGQSQGQSHSDTPQFNGELMDIGGVFESLPPFEVMEDLNRIFFERQQALIPVIHPYRYLQAFYSAPHMKPPMCLQYAIWALAANGHPKYGAYHEIFYHRARQYADSDEMKGYGEHFITVAHAQAWCVIATWEAKCMMFTRAAMSSSRAVRLVHMMSLHRLDGSAEEISPTLLPPRDWIELEERRRVFWGVFCIDSHCSISTGWPFLIDPTEITTLLPAPESAFHNGEKVETFSIHEAFKGKPYSSFAGAVLVCHIFNQLLKHVHRPKPNDNPDNYEYGEYWQRHREMDNTLSSAFMYLPESFRLPENYRDSVAVHTNLNLHASIICLHHSAIDRIDTYGLPESAKKASQDRLSTAAQEIVNIVKLTSHVSSGPKSPLAAMALYCAASVYVYLCKEGQGPTYVDNLDFIIAAMEALGRDHAITRAFLRQVVVDIERNGVQHIVHLPRIADLGPVFHTQLSHNIPLLARSKISRHTEVQPPLPGRLPLGRPIGKTINGDEDEACEHGTWTSDSQRYDRTLQDSLREIRSDEPSGHNKRKRTVPPGSSTLDDGSELTGSQWAAAGIQDRVPTNPSTHPSPAGPSNLPGGGTFQQRPIDLPHRTGSPHINTNPGPTSRSNGRGGIGVGVSPALFSSMGPTPFRTAGRGPSQTKSTKDGVGDWELIGTCMHAQFAANGAGFPVDQPQQELIPNANITTGTMAQDDNIPWALAGDEVMNIDWDVLHESLGIDFGGVIGEEGVGDDNGGEGPGSG
ncbi:hypothetical protein M426DRAFT_9314 [Hypoxylon sp. CI-4A]|nr:hypothetical protein M426DRAFT_9314 [Hypoxylon sp. CI-4A]